MKKLHITGGIPLNGELSVHGAKNSSLPILAAAASVHGKTILHNCPQLSDVDAACEILSSLGCRIIRTATTVEVDSTANNASNTVSGSANNTSVQASTSENQNSTSDSADQSEADSKGNSVGAVETGDNPPILPYVIIGIAAAVIVAVLVYLKKKK